LVPDTAYGHLMAEALRDFASAGGGTVAKVAFYDPRAGDAATAAGRLLPGSPAPPSADPAAPDQIVPPPPAMTSFDALLLPVGGSQLKEMARALTAAGLDTKTTRLLGSGLWDVPDLASEPALDGGWFAASPPEARRDFEQRYRATYGRGPPRLASLGYDAAALAAVLARGQGGPPFSTEAILDPNGFSGVDGLFRFTPQGLVQRGLAVLEVEPQGNIVVSPAPQSFHDIGY
jgi:branched-chain amino acid transport system substrate-binding protein